MPWRKRRQLRVTSASLTGRQDCTRTPRSGREHATPGRSGRGAGTQRCAATPPLPVLSGSLEFTRAFALPFPPVFRLPPPPPSPRNKPPTQWWDEHRDFSLKKSTNMPVARALNFCGRANCPSKACFYKNFKKRKEGKHTQRPPIFKLQSSSFFQPKRMKPCSLRCLHLFFPFSIPLPPHHRK